MAFSASITLTIAGADTGPFNLLSDIDGYFIPFETSVPKSSLVAGYLSNLVPDGTSIIRVKSNSVLCPNYIDLTISGTTTTTTTTSTSTTSTTTSTTTTETPNTFDGTGDIFPSGDNANSIFVASTFSISGTNPVPPSGSGAITLTPSATMAAGFTTFTTSINDGGSSNITVILTSFKLRDNTTSTDYNGVITNNNTPNVTVTITIPNVSGHNFTLSGSINFSGG